MKKRVKVIGGVSVVVLLIVYGVVTALMPMPIETKTLSRESSALKFVEKGVVVNDGEKIIYPMVAGEVDKIIVKEGDLVKKDQVLASLDHSAIELELTQMEKNVEALEAQMAMAKVEYENSISTLTGNKAQLQGQLNQLNAQTGSSTSRALEQLLLEQSKGIYERGLEDLEKQKELYELGYISESTLNDYKTLVDQYEANYNTNKIASEAGSVSYSAMRSGLGAQIESIDATLERDMLTPTMVYYQALLDGAIASLEAMKVKGSYYNITSPVEGYVNEIMIENANMVTGISPAFTVQGEGTNKIEVKVNTRDLGVISVGDKVDLILDRRDGDIETEGTITYISSSASVEMSALGLEERKVQVIIEPLDQSMFASGYDVDVRFIIHNALDKLILPNSALYKKDTQDMVMVIRNSTAVEIPVVLGYELTGETVVEEGLEEGDRVIIDLDAKGLKAGTKVKSSNE